MRNQREIRKYPIVIHQTFLHTGGIPLYRQKLKTHTDGNTHIGGKPPVCVFRITGISQVFKIQKKM